MPGRDGTGPMGLGTMTGRGFGPCACAAPARQGLGLGFGRRHCFRGGFGAGYAHSQGITRNELLKEQKEFLQRRIELIDKQMTNE